jgi:hypothetical protein
LIRIDPAPERIDWFRVLADLQWHGVSTTLFAKRINVPHSTLIGWKNEAPSRDTRTASDL